MVIMKIREVKRPGDRIYGAVAALLPQLSPGAAGLTPEHFRKILGRKGTHLFVAEHGKKIAGMLTLVSYETPSATRFWIEDVVVDDSLRGKGIGRELVRYAIDFARSKGACAVDLTSRPSREAANFLYKKMGFELRETNAYRYHIRNPGI